MPNEHALRIPNFYSDPNYLRFWVRVRPRPGPARVGEIQRQRSRGGTRWGAVIPWFLPRRRVITAVEGVLVKPRIPIAAELAARVGEGADRPVTQLLVQAVRRFVGLGDDGDGAAHVAACHAGDQGSAQSPR